MDFSDTAGMLAEQSVQGFAACGHRLMPQAVDPSAASELLADIRSTRRFDHSLFLSEQAFDADPRHTGVNPRPGRNLLDRLEHRLGFVEDAPQIVHALTTLLGVDYRCLDRKIVCGVPARAMPAWLKPRLADKLVNNLGAYVRPEVRDITYFYGIDFHQDLIDYRGAEADFLTLYVYLHPVGLHDAPLYLLEGSHALGASVFPHTLQRTQPSAWRYDNGAAGALEVRQRVLTGETGFAALWHACTLHGAQPSAAEHERLSLRFLFAPGRSRSGRIDEVNRALRGPLKLETTRNDLDVRGAAAPRRNAVGAA